MREIRICYNVATKDILIEEPPNTKNYLGNFGTAKGLGDYFNKNPVGIHLKQRRKLHMLVDLEGITDDTFLSSIKHTLGNIKWNKAEIVYSSLSHNADDTR